MFPGLVMNILGGVIYTYVKQLERGRQAGRRASQMAEVEAGRAGEAREGRGKLPDSMTQAQPRPWPSAQ